MKYEDPFADSLSPFIHHDRRQFINKQPLQQQQEIKQGGSVSGVGDAVKQYPVVENPTTTTQSQNTLTTLATPLTGVTTPTTVITGSTATFNNTTTNNYNGSCEVPSIAEFPSDLFSQYQRLHGAFIIHTLIAIYMCVGLAIICDYYFIPSLEVICYKLDLQADVAGASFMAIGSSAPELFASVIGKSRFVNGNK